MNFGSVSEGYSQQSEYYNGESVHVVQSQSAYGGNVNSGTSSDNETTFLVMIVTVMAAGAALAIILLICCCRGLCCIIRKQKCRLLCRMCRRSCLSQCGYATPSIEEAIGRYHEGILENEELFTEAVIDNYILKVVVGQILAMRRDFLIGPEVVGSLKERFGKPTRIITEDYPYGIPSRSPLCTDVDVMLITDTVTASHQPQYDTPYILLIQPSPFKGYIQLVVQLPPHCPCIPPLLAPLVNTEDNLNAGNGTTKMFLSSNKVQKDFESVVSGLNFKKIYKKSKLKFHSNRKVSNVKIKGPAVNVTLRQHYPCSTRCCMLGECTAKSLFCCSACCVNDDDLDIMFQADLTFAIKCNEWPHAAMEWPTRTRFWPSTAVVPMVVQLGCSIVPKPQGGDENLWRYSFSVAEYYLVHHIPEPTKRAFTALKGMVRRDDCQITSYALKSLLFWCLEEQADQEMWSDSKNMVRIFYTLLESFHNRIEQDKCNHYFMPDINLLEGTLVHQILPTFAKFKSNTFYHITNRELERKRCCSLSTLICRLLCGCHATDHILDAAF